jgi:hypothetical protein
MRYLFAFVFVGASFAIAQTAPSTQPDGRVESLVAQLGDQQWAVRQAAQDQLVATGPSVVARLRAVASQTRNDEIRQRAEAAIAEINENLLTGPSLITLHLKDASVRDAFAELSRQAGTNLTPMPPELWELKTWPKINVDLEREPFWSALRAIGAQAGVELRQWNDGLRLMQSGGAGPSGGRFVVSGPFLITLTRCSRTQVIEYGLPGGENPSSDFAIYFSATAEPKLRVLRAAYAAKLDEATDDRGNSLVPRAGDDGNDNGLHAASGVDTSRVLEAAFATGAGGVWQFSARLAYPQNMGKRLVTLRGSVNVLLQTHVETIEIPAVLSAANTSRSAGGLRLTVTEAKKNGDRYDIIATIARDAGSGGSAIEWDRVQQSLSDLKLIDAQGRPLLRTNLASGMGNDSVELNLSFTRGEVLNIGGAGAVGGRIRNAANEGGEGPTDPVKLVWQVPTETKEVNVPFEFKDVPLPE